MTAQLGLDFATVDVFTQTRFEGNQLAIVQNIPLSFALTRSQKQHHCQRVQSLRQFFCMNTEKIRDTNGPSAFTQPIRSCPLQAIPPSVPHVTFFQKLPSRSPTRVKTSPTPSSTPRQERLICATSSQKKLPKAAIPHDIHIHKKKYNRESFLSLQLGLNKAGRSSVSGLKAESDVVSIVIGMTFVFVELGDEDALRAVSATSGVVIAKLDEG